MKQVLLLSLNSTPSMQGLLVQEYQLLSAMAYIGLRKWPEAQYHLEHVLATPTTNTASALMVEAYKKWLLVGLLVEGKVPNLPRPASGNAMKTIKPLSRFYEAVVDAFKLTNPEKLSAEICEAQSTFEEDGNLGLVQNVIAHHRKLFVIRFADIYAAMTITKLAADLHMTSEETEEYISSLIKEGLLRAEIEAPTQEKPSVVRFLHDTASLDLAAEEQLRQQLLDQMSRVKALDTHVAEADHRLALTKEYAEHVRRARKAKQEQKDNGETGDAMDFTQLVPGPGSDEEESVMVDVQ